MSTTACESVQSLLARRASVQDLLHNGTVSADIVRGTLVLKNGSATLFSLKELLKAHGCKIDMKTKTWRRPSVTVAERHAVSTLKAREATRDKLEFDEKRAIIDIILAHVNAVDARARDSTWVGMPCAPPTSVITAEARAREWARHGLKPPTSFRRPRRDVYGNICD